MKATFCVYGGERSLSERAERLGEREVLASK